jgi:hypothetical protein
MTFSTRCINMLLLLFQRRDKPPTPTSLHWHSGNIGLRRSQSIILKRMFTSSLCLRVFILKHKGYRYCIEICKPPTPNIAATCVLFIINLQIMLAVTILFDPEKVKKTITVIPGKWCYMLWNVHSVPKAT